LHPWAADWTQALTAHDIFVHLGAPESFGVVILEAFARGCRGVVLPKTFLDELPAPHGQAGVFRASALNPVAVAEALIRAADPAGSGANLWADRRAVQGVFCMEQHVAPLSSWYSDMAHKLAIA
ncbi:MAG: glycosyltransferase, partial [Limisphaerales bacterium]